jgi:hypothetical protein
MFASRSLILSSRVDMDMSERKEDMTRRMK